MILPISDHLGQTRARIRFRMLAQKKKNLDMFTLLVLFGFYTLIVEGPYPKKKKINTFF